MLSLAHSGPLVDHSIIIQVLCEDTINPPPTLAMQRKQTNPPLQSETEIFYTLLPGDAINPTELLIV